MFWEYNMVTYADSNLRLLQKEILLKEHVDSSSLAIRGTLDQSSKIQWECWKEVASKMLLLLQQNYNANDKDIAFA